MQFLWKCIEIQMPSFACLKSTVTMVHDFRCNYSRCLTHYNRNRASFAVISPPNVIQYVYKFSITYFFSYQELLHFFLKKKERLHFI